MVVSVKSWPVGRMAFESQQRGGLITSPVKFNIKDSPQVNQLKALVSTMISFDPKERPSIDEVLESLQAIAGTDLCYIC